MFSLVLKAYDMDDQADAVMTTAESEQYDIPDVSAWSGCELLCELGLRCTVVVTGRVPVPAFIQDAADRDHLVLVAMEPSELDPRPHWGVLEKSRPGRTCIITFGPDESDIHHDTGAEHHMAGEYIICLDRCPMMENLASRTGKDR